MEKKIKHKNDNIYQLEMKIIWMEKNYGLVNISNQRRNNTSNVNVISKYSTGSGIGSNMPGMNANIILNPSSNKGIQLTPSSNKNESRVYQPNMRYDYKTIMQQRNRT